MCSGRCGLEQIQVGGKCMKRGGRRAVGAAEERIIHGVKWKDGGEKERERESERKGASGRKMGPPRREERMNADLARVN